MNDLTYEFQRMISRRAEIRTATKDHGAQNAWDQYSSAHGLDRQRFKDELPQLRRRFDEIGALSVHE
jgi:hypothetical protein